MRIGKKAKEIESKSQVVEGINRLICTTKSQSYSLKGINPISNILFKELFSYF